MGIRTRRAAVVAAVAVLTLVSLAALALDRLAGPAIATDGTATLDGLTVDVEGAEWVPMDHLDSNFPMPGQMMPGAPEGDEVRLGISITLSNTDGATRGFSLVGEFALTGGARTEPTSLSADTIGALPRLGPGAAVAGTLYFDVEVPGGEDPPLYLLWSRGGQAVRIALPSLGDAPDHGHG